MKRLIVGMFPWALIATISGCAAIGTEVTHGSLQTQTLMSKSVFLTPVPNSEKTIYLQVRNTTDKPNFTITNQLSTALQEKGYRLTDQMSQAHYLLQVELLQVGKSSKTAAKEMLGTGYGGILEGATTGAMIAGSEGASGGAVAGAGIAGAVLATVIDDSVKDVTYTGVVDVKITEETAKHGKVYQTRIAITANQVDLSFEKASPQLQNGLAQSISGIF